ncbi:hypothetical protein [Kalamiella sp. sgz302252]|uniref:hypothetical protein n=1 Tax=Pantoea sp. sgz302252 TaxID=3341827 RepID=UPI0036D2932E
MKKLLAVIFMFLLSGCVDSGNVGTHPGLKIAYLNGKPHEVSACLYSAALSQSLRLTRDGRLPDGTEKYNLQNNRNEVIAWVEISRFSHDQTSVWFYQGKGTDIHAAIAAMTESCKNTR